MRWIDTLLCALVLATACSAGRIANDGTTSTQPAASLPEPLVGGGARAEERRDLTALRRSTAPFLDFAQAKAAGWSTEITGCMEGPEGGMGYHYANAKLVDGSVRPDEPEVLIYEPEPGGKPPRLVGVEYIVPLAAWHDAKPPRLFGRDFTVDELFQLWALHVWAWESNPRGLFHDWNPRVSCDDGPELSGLTHD